MIHRWADNDPQDTSLADAERERYYWNLSRQQAREAQRARFRLRFVSLTCGLMMLPLALFAVFIVLAAIVNALHL